MKSAPATGALLLEITPLRPPNQKRSDLFNPFHIRLLLNCQASRLRFCLAASALFPLYCLAPSLWIFSVPKETNENGKSFRRTPRQRKNIFQLTLRRSRDISIGHLRIVWNRKKPRFSKALWTC